VTAVEFICSIATIIFYTIACLNYLLFNILLAIDVYFICNYSFKLRVNILEVYNVNSFTRFNLSRLRFKCREDLNVCDTV